MTVGIPPLGSNEGPGVTFTGSTNQNVGLPSGYSADFSAVANQPLPADPPPPPAAGSGTGSEPTLTVTATNPADVTFTVLGVPSADHGTVTFTDVNGVQDVVNIGSNGYYSANLSNLATGTIDYTLSVTDPAGNVTTVDPSTSLNSIAGFALNAEGWPIITPPAGARIIYVSSSTGNNNNNGLTPQTAVATIAAGEALLQNDSADELLLKAGDTFVNQAFGDLTVSGESAADPIVIGTYGTGPAPIVETLPSVDYGVAIGSLPGQGGNNIVVEGINFYDYTRDPSNPAYAGPSTTDQGAAFFNPGTIALIGDTFSFYPTNVAINFGSGTSPTPNTTVTLYRDVIKDFLVRYVSLSRLVC